MYVKGAGFLVGVAVSILTLLGTATIATAAPQGPWVLPAEDLSTPGQSSHRPQVAASPDGTLTTVWTHNDGGNWIVQAVTRRPGDSSFGLPEDLSAPGWDAQGTQLAVSPDGTVTVVWSRFDGSNWIVQATTRRPEDSHFRAPVNLSAPGRNANGPQLAVSPDGTVTVVWSRFDGSNWIVQAATRRPDESGFSLPVDLSPSGQHSVTPALAASPDGTVTVSWIRRDGSEGIIQAATRAPAGNFFGVPVNLNDPVADLLQLRLAASPDGTVTAIWVRWDGGTRVVQTATRPPGGSFGAATDLSDPGQNSDSPQLAVAPDGTLTAIWNRWNGSNWVIQTATRPPGGSFGATTDLSDPGQDGLQPRITASADRTVTAAWASGSSGNRVIQTATRPPGSGLFGSSVNLSEPGADEPQLAVSPNGTATAVWSRDTGGNSVVQAASTRRPHVLHVSKTGTGSGRVGSTPAGIECGADCTAEYPPSTTVTLTARPDPGSTFTRWEGACQGVKPVCTVKMDGARTATATFSRVPSDPPDGGTAVYDPATGKLKIRLKCGRQYRPKCLKMVAWGVTDRMRKARAMTSKAKARNRRAGSSIQTTLKVKPEFRQRVEKMGQGTGKSLRVRIRITFRKKTMLKIRRRGKVRKVVRRVKRVRTVHHRYRVLVR